MNFGWSFKYFGKSIFARWEEMKTQWQTHRMSSSQIVKFHSRLKSARISFSFFFAIVSHNLRVSFSHLPHNYISIVWLATFLNIVSLALQRSEKKPHFTRNAGAFCVACMRKSNDATDSIKCCCYFWSMLVIKLYTLWINRSQFESASKRLRIAYLL